MTSLLRITDGTTTLNFSTGDDMRLITYRAEVSTNGENIRESARVDFTGSAVVNTATMRTLNRLFEQARYYANTEQGARVYIEYDPGTSGTYWRSRIFDARIVQPDNLLGPWMYDTRWMVTIEWERQPFWEGALTQLPLTNTSATNDLAGITVDNANDATNSQENWVSIDGANMDGDLPAPIKVEMYNAYASADPADEIYIFHNLFSNPESFTHILEGEDASAITATVTPTAEGTPGSSEDSYGSIAWTATAETGLCAWTISSAQLGYAAGGRFALIARWNAAFPYSDMYLRFKFGTAGYIFKTYDKKLVPNTRELHWLETIDLPPYLPGQSSMRAITLRLFGHRNQAGTHTLPLDYLFVAPISGRDGWLHFLSDLGGVAYQEYFYYDGTEGFTYSLDTSGNKIAEFAIYGGPLLLTPGFTQYLYFLTCDDNGLALVEQSWTVKCWYRPRRSAL